MTGDDVRPDLFEWLGDQMKEGAWLNARTGAYHWIDEHALWLQRRDNAKSLGVPDEVVLQIKAIPWDFNGEGRRSILRLAMGSGLIRFRGHGNYVTFEGLLPIREIASGARGFMEHTLGPLMEVRINDLSRQESWAGRYEDMLLGLRISQDG